MKNNVPKLRFPEFSGEWVQSTIGNLCQVKTGDKDTQNKVGNGVYPFFVRSDNIERINSYSYDGEAILTAGDGVGVGKVFHYINGKFDYHQRVYNIHDFKNACGRYVYYYFSNSFYNHVSRLSAKNSVDSVRRDMIVNMPISIPILEEQTKIAHFLTGIDDKIQQLTKKKKLLEQYKKGVTQQIFSQQIRFRDDNGNNYPLWKSQLLRQLFTIGSGKDYKHLLAGNVPVYGTGGVLANVSDYLYDGESVCIGRKGTIDKPTFINNKFWTVDTLFYTFDFNNCTPKFIYYLFQTINWFLYNEASGVPSLSKSTIELIMVEVPNIKEQTKIAEFLTNIDEKITQVNTQLEKTKLFKKSLLQQLLVE